MKILTAASPTFFPIPDELQQLLVFDTFGEGADAPSRYLRNFSEVL
jgi:hypothetical protein